MTDTTMKDDGDWLGYGVYADTLWQRIVRALDKDDLGDDPLVIGLFGEWGAGKSYLLNLIEKHAREHADIKIGWRKRDGGAKGYVLTIPVNFQPWKYEHEEHLLIPMLLHILQSLEKDIKTGQTWAEAAGDKIPASIKDHIGLFVKAFGVLLYGTAFALSTNVPIASKLGLAIAGLGAKIVGKKDKPVDKSQTVDFEYEADGRTYYEIHETLKGITRPNKFGKSVGITISENIEVNFVVFIDDLDRCLPEQAVKTLEMIKTVFNIDSFAFVLALDDEVIERGIAHRYKDYALVDKKQQMPITGFEYLEKIVHLPFRLPQLTKAQAQAFLAFEEKRIAGNKQTWFTVQSLAKYDGTFANDGSLKHDGSLTHSKNLDSQETQPMVASVLTGLFLASFEAYVPRKMVRVIELMHQIAHITSERGKPLSAPHSNIDEVAPEVAGGRDIRVVFTLLMLQLFQPELFRLLRRKEAAFPTLLAAFASDLGGLSGNEISEIDLWTWATFRKQGDVRSKVSNASEALSGIATETQSLYNAQQIRLPVVTKLVEHLQIQRHVFNPLKLINALAKSLGESAKAVQISEYFSLLGEQAVSPISGHASMNLEPATMGLTTFDRSNDIQSLVDAITERDTGGQANLASRLELPALLEGKKLSRETYEKLHETLKSWITSDPIDGKAAHLLQGLSHISPWVDWQNGGRNLWNLVSNAVNTDQNRVYDILDLIPALSRMQTAGWLSDSKEINTVRQALLTQLASSGLKPEPRARVGDALGTIGDPRFEGKYASPKRSQSDAPEAPAGFVKVHSGDYLFGNKFTRRRHDYDYYISRYLITVAQYSAFVDAKAYDNQPLWESSSKHGWQWRTGEFDFFKTISSTAYQVWLARRPKGQRNQPLDWNNQLRYPHRPVTGINWFEATTYAAWLEQLRQDILVVGINKEVSENATILKNLLPHSLFSSELLNNEKLNQYRLRLPLEDEWERAAKNSQLGEFPWGNDTKIDSWANVDKRIGHATAVGSFPANDYGLYDMAGNVHQWQSNIYSDVYKGKLISVDQEIKISSSFEETELISLRGGSWKDPSSLASCTSNISALPTECGSDIGFRLVLSLANL